MKKTILSAFTLLIFATSFNSCKKKDTSAPTTPVIQAYYTINSNAAVAHTFPTGMQMTVTQSQNNSFFDGTDPNTNHTLDISMSGTTNGTYTFGQAQASFMQLHISGIAFTTNAPGGSGHVQVTYNTTTMWATGSFSGTVVDPNNPVNTISISQGTFAIHYVQ